MGTCNSDTRKNETTEAPRQLASQEDREYVDALLAKVHALEDANGELRTALARAQAHVPHRISARDVLEYNTSDDEAPGKEEEDSEQARGGDDVSDVQSDYSSATRARVQVTPAAAPAPGPMDVRVRSSFDRSEEARARGCVVVADLESRADESLLTGLCVRGSEAERAAFLHDEWLPFIKQLRIESLQVQTRTLSGFGPEERMPPQKKVLEWTEQCLQLTRKWYGEQHGNVSAVYEFLMEVSTHAKIAAYSFAELPHPRSADGFSMAIDGLMRKKLYRPSNESGSDEESEAEDEAVPPSRVDTMDRTGHLDHDIGESAIDNSVLPNVMTPLQSRILLAGGKIKTLLLRKATQRQAMILTAVGEHFGEDLHKSTPGHVKERLQALVDSPELAKKLGVVASNFSFKALLRLGAVTKSWGQLSKSAQRRVHRYLSKELREHYDEERQSRAISRAKSRNSASPLSDGAESDAGSSMGDDGAVIKQQVEEFIVWSRENPGRIYKGDKKLHKKLLFWGLWSQELALVKRSVIEEHTVFRYLPVPWERRVPLIRRDADGTEVVVRDAGAEEYSRFRRNKFPYLGPSHGMGISSGGLEEGIETHGSVRYELGTTLPSDDSAKLGNWFLNDFEKILAEVRVLNPAGGVTHLLPGEEFHDVAQNPKAASSIGATQHTQCSRSIAEDWPVLVMQQHPIWCDKLRAFIDLVHVGEEFDAVSLRLRTQRPDALEIVQFLQSLRLEMMRRFGGQNVDFFVGGYPEGVERSGWFTVVFTPIANLEWVEDPSLPYKVTQNPDTGERWSIDKHAVGVMDAASARGGCLCFSETSMKLALRGQATVRCAYDFARKLGARKLLRRVLLREFGYVDRLCSTRDVLTNSSSYVSVVREPVFSPLLDSSRSREKHAAKLDLDHVPHSPVEEEEEEEEED